jgi:hypothetical protein
VGSFHQLASNLWMSCPSHQKGHAVRRPGQPCRGRLLPYQHVGTVRYVMQIYLPQEPGCINRRGEAAAGGELSTALGVLLHA